MRIAIIFLFVSFSAWTKNFECKVPDKKYIVKIEEYADSKSQQLRFIQNKILLKECSLVLINSKRIDRYKFATLVTYYKSKNCVDYIANKIKLKNQISLISTEKAKTKYFYLHFEESLDGVSCN